MKLRCAILDDYQNVALTMTDWSGILDQVELRVFNEHMFDEEALVEAIADCDIVVAMRERTPFRASLFDRLPQLKLLITTGMRNASIDLAAARSHGVVVCGTAGGAQSTAELTWALLLGLARHVVSESRSLQTGGPWQSTLGTDLYGKRLGLVGLGRIGSQVARVGLAFGMDVVSWSQNLTRERAEAVGVRFAASKQELLEESDFVSIHLVLSDRTVGLLGAQDLRRMKKTAYLINTSRAPIVDQLALKEALREGWIAGAGLDVFEREPLAEDDEFRRLRNVLATPHIGYVTQETYAAWYDCVVEDIRAFLQSAPIRVLS